jgi:hypothetical protein
VLLFVLGCAETVVDCMRALVILVNRKLPQYMQRMEVSDGIPLHIFCSCDFEQDDHNYEA